MDKKKRKEIRNQLAKTELAEFRKSLPADENIFPKLFDLLDNQLYEKGCKHTTILTKTFLHKNGVINVTQVIEWLAENGGFCDCEILANVEYRFEYLNANKIKPVLKKLIQKQKLNSLSTDFAFCIDKVPSPWNLTETTLDNKKNYTFQIGKGTGCIVRLETLYPSLQIKNDKYWMDSWVKETELDYKLGNLVIERPEIDGYSCIVAKSKDWTPVIYWLKSDLTDKWYLKIKTSSSRHKGDFKEFLKLLNSIQVDIK